MTTTAFDISRLGRTTLSREARWGVIETPRLTLRRPEEQDIVAMTALADNPRVAARAWAMPQPYTIADAGRFIRRARDRASGLTAFAVMRGDDNTYLGSIKVEADHDEGALGFWLGEPHWNCGYATEAAQAVLDLAFSEVLWLARLSAFVQINNAAARRVLEKCGFQYAGPATGIDMRNGGLVAADRYVLDRGIWKALKAWAAGQ